MKARLTVHALFATDPGGYDGFRRANSARGRAIGSRETRPRNRLMVAGGMPKSDHQSQLPFASLRTSLIWLPPTGEAGFEKLVAVACAQVAQMPFRLIGSGRQFGRDVEAVVDGTGILFEAKRYNSPLSYAALSGKLQEALGRSGRRVEVWGAAATIPLDAHDAEDLRRYGEDNGVTVLLLDWAEASPPLAVLPSSAREAVLEWCERKAPGLVAKIGRDLDEVRDTP